MRIETCPIHPGIGVPCWHVQWEEGDPQYGLAEVSHTCFMSLEQFVEGTQGASRRTMAQEVLTFLYDSHSHTFVDSGVGDPYEFTPHPIDKGNFIRRKVFADGSALVWNNLPRRKGGAWEVELPGMAEIPGYRDGKRVYPEVPSGP